MERRKLASIISSLRRVHPRVPFFQLAAHTFPTRWTLYRGLLRLAPGEEARWKIRGLFRKNQRLTSPQQTKEQLERGYELLETFSRAKKLESEAKNAAAEFERAAERQHIKRDNEERRAMDMAQRSKLARENKPRLTGAYLRPSLYNRALPRMRNQPVEISMMISKRMKARARRQEAIPYWNDVKSDIMLEATFERAAHLAERSSSTSPSSKADGERCYMHAIPHWLEPVHDHIASMQRSYQLDESRARSKYTPHQLAHIKEARTFKILNKTREKQRERDGEILNSTLRRWRSGVPPHIWVKMTDEEKAEDRRRRREVKGGLSELGVEVRQRYDELQRAHSARHESDSNIR